MEERTVIGSREVQFTDNTGRTVSGVTLYVEWEDEKVRGKCAERLFVSDKLIHDAGFIPDLGDTFKVVYNRYGKIAAITA